MAKWRPDPTDPVATEAGLTSRQRRAKLDRERDELVKRLRAEVERLRKRLTIDGPHPVDDDFYAHDLANARVEALRLAIDEEEVSDE